MEINALPAEGGEAPRQLAILFSLIFNRGTVKKASRHAVFEIFPGHPAERAVH